MAIKAGISIPQPCTYAFHQVFLEDVRKRGRVFEGRLMQSYMFKSGEIWRKLKSGEITDEVALGLTLLRKGRMPLFPKGIKAKREVKEILK
jgi:heterodisulfide reductase subunit C